jgi:lactate dehydrogenase-like 2-hydroxyacid dehydrogenase
LPRDSDHIDVFKCDVIWVHDDRGLFNKERISKMKKGAYIVNNARGAIADVDAVKEAVESGQLGGMHLSFYSIATARSSLTLKLSGQCV